MARKRAIKGDAERQLLDALRAGAFVREAAQHVGVGERTVYEEMERNPQFSQAVTRARADAHVGAVAVVRRAMAEDWRAAAFYLERTDPASWGRRTAHEHSGPGGEPVPVDAKTELDISDPETRRLLDELLARAAGS